jgi:hypothetical protein
MRLTRRFGGIENWKLPMLLHISALIATVAIGQAVVEQPGGALPHTLAGSGSFDFLTAESSPVYFRGEVYVAETIDNWYNDSLTQPNRSLAHCSSYYRVRHAVSGEVVVNISESCDRSFLAAFVDTAPNGTSILWLFGTAWRRGTRGHKWSGDCANAATCHLDAFYTHDLQHWWTATNVLVPGAMTYNNNVYRQRQTRSFWDIMCSWHLRARTHRLGHGQHTLQ